MTADESRCDQTKGPLALRSASWPWRIVTSFLVMMAIVIPVMLCIPLQIFVANHYEFSASLYDIAPVLLAMAGMLTVALSMLLLLLPEPIHRAVLALGAAVALLVWIQGQLLIRNYGALDGSPIEWMDWPGRAVCDLLLWFGVLVLAFYQRKRIALYAGLLALVLLLIQGVPTAWLVYRYEALPAFHRYNFSDQQKFSFSPERNVIVIVLDAFQADVFGRLLEAEPGLNEQFEGFTWYRNALAGYSKTYPSFVLMLTGKWYDNDLPIQDFINTSLAQGSVTKALRDLHWRVDLFPHIKRILPPLPEIADNVIASTDCRTLRFESGKLADLGWFRASPHLVKRFWLNDYEWRIARIVRGSCFAGTSRAAQRSASMSLGRTQRHSALEFLHQAEVQTRVTLQQPGFKLYHLMIPHAPFHLDEDLEVGELPAGEEGFVRQSRGALEIIKRFFQTLRENGAYDQSTVIVTSDHGGGEYIGPMAMDAQETTIPGSHIASGLALVMVKPRFARGRLRASDAPVSLADLAPTIAAESGAGVSFPGRSVLEIAAGEQRERYYRHYSFNGWSGRFLPEMTEYSVDGPTWQAESWSPTGQVFHPVGTSGQLDHWRFPIGRRFGFRPGSPAIQLLANGWSEANPRGLVWSNDDRAELVIPLEGSVDRALVARFDVLPYTGGGLLDTAHIELSVNETITKRWALSERDWISVEIPKGMAGDTSELRFRFYFPDAVSPFELGRSSDGRQLGAALYNIDIRFANEDGN